MNNGYEESIIPDHDENRCWFCGCNGYHESYPIRKIDRHEVFGGAYREKSKRLGLWVHLCHYPCHMDYFTNSSDEKSRLAINMLKREAQKCAMEKYGWSTEKFIKEFGENYL